MTLADARARRPTLEAIAHDPTANEDFLNLLAEVALDFTPSVAFDAPHGLLLDITGCAHLFGGEAPLADRFKAALATEGISLSQMAIAPTPDMARALARFAHNPLTIAMNDQPVRALSVAAFECGFDDRRALERAGLRTIADVADRPSPLFTSRFTRSFTSKLARLLGEEDRRITPYRPQPPCRVEQSCPEPVTSQAAIEEIVATLFARACATLAERNLGGRAFETTYVRSDGARRRVGIATSHPTRDLALLAKLYRDRLGTIADPFDPGFGFDLIRLEVVSAEPLIPQALSLDATPETSHETSGTVAALCDRLTTIFGSTRIVRLDPVDTHAPETTQQRNSVSARRPSAPWVAVAEGARPLHLFPTPQLIAVNAAVANACPTRFTWRRVTYEAIKTVGPERIAEEWWLAPSGFGTRDYYHFAAHGGQRFWIFRAFATEFRDHDQQVARPTGTGAWFLHGVFA